MILGMGCCLCGIFGVFGVLVWAGACYGCQGCEKDGFCVCSSFQLDVYFGLYKMCDLVERCLCVGCFLVSM